MQKMMSGYESPGIDVTKVKKIISTKQMHLHWLWSVIKQSFLSSRVVIWDLQTNRIESHSRSENLVSNVLIIVKLPLKEDCKIDFLSFSLKLSVFRAVFKWLLKNQNQSNYSDQSQQEQAAQWTNHNS